ncbi:MAG: hypothetical protein JWO69_1451 [Thermoleophilia bacterium]|jgi:hypothetical protein|nr:hypothetical protein [Thermoleophilia bacterium]
MADTLDDYDPALLEAVLAEVAYLVRTVGGTGSDHHIVLIGGLAPSLLVPDPLPDDAHIGTTDIDICLSVALTEGDTEEYERLETLIKGIGYRQADTSFRWKRAGLVPVTLEFFCPAGPDRPAGRTYRPRSSDNPTAKHNLGSTLSALALDAGDILTRDVVEYAWKGELPDDKGIAPVTLRVTGIAGFIVAKAAALDKRDKPKDGYDIVWVLDNWPGGPSGAATALVDSGFGAEENVVAALGLLRTYFETARHRGAVMYGELWAQVNAANDAATAIERARRSVVVIDEFLEALSAD